MSRAWSPQPAALKSAAALSRYGTAERKSGFQFPKMDVCID